MRVLLLFLAVFLALPAPAVKAQTLNAIQFRIEW